MRSALLALLAVPVALAAGLAAIPASASALQAYYRTMRPLIVFAPSEGDERLARQRELLAPVAAGLDERDQIVLVVVGEEAVTSLSGGAPLGDASDAAALRERFGIPAGGFAAVLVGKDGGEKLRRAEPLDPAELFATIDAMPMRRRELRERGE